MKAPRSGKRTSAAGRDETAPRLLVVDDIEDNREIYRLMFETNGYEVATAEDGLDALSVVESFQPDVIVMDLSMPAMNGWDAIARLRAREDTRATPIVVLTGHVGGEEARRAMAAGANRVCLKPCLPDEMYSEVELLLGRRGGSKPGATESAKQR